MSLTDSNCYKNMERIPTSDSRRHPLFFNSELGVNYNHYVKQQEEQSREREKMCQIQILDGYWKEAPCSHVVQ